VLAYITTFIWRAAERLLVDHVVMTAVIVTELKQDLPY